jgi:hypothetical protein
MVGVTFAKNKRKVPWPGLMNKPLWTNAKSGRISCTLIVAGTQRLRKSKEIDGNQGKI